jgi:hypothetical protein
MGHTQTSGYTRGRIRCLGGVVPCQPVKPTMSPISDQVNGTNRSQDQCVKNSLTIYLDCFAHGFCCVTNFLKANWFNNVTRWSSYVYIDFTMLQGSPVMCLLVKRCYRAVQVCVYWYNYVRGRSSYVYIGLTMLQGGPVMCILV